MSEMLNRVAAFGGDNGACGAPDTQCWKEYNERTGERLC